MIFLGRGYTRILLRVSVAVSRDAIFSDAVHWSDRDAPADGGWYNLVPLNTVSPVGAFH